MKALLFTHHTELGLEEVEFDQLKNKLSINHLPIEQIDIDSQQGSEIARAYDVMDAPALILIREDGVAQAFWQTDLPTDNQLYAALGYI
jgi:hypothetical protein